MAIQYRKNHSDFEIRKQQIIGKVRYLFWTCDQYLVGKEERVKEKERINNPFLANIKAFRFGRPAFSKGAQGILKAPWSRVSMVGLGWRSRARVGRGTVFKTTTT